MRIFYPHRPRLDYLIRSAPRLDTLLQIKDQSLLQKTREGLEELYMQANLSHKMTEIISSLGLTRMLMSSGNEPCF